MVVMKMNRQTIGQAEKMYVETERERERWIETETKTEIIL